jgi:beta-phosphoglucomutase
MSQQAYIFDFDGVLVDSLGVHFRCYKAACAEVGVSVSWTQFLIGTAMSSVAAIAYFAEQAGKTVDAEAVYRRKQELYAEQSPDAELIAGNYLLITMLHAAGVKTAIASGSRRAEILPLTDKYNISCDVLVTADDVSRGKPHPEIFLKAAELLGVKPEDCTVIEDSDTGTEAAMRAGMAVLRYFAPVDKR